MIRSAGFMIGLVIGLILVVVLLRFANYNKRVKTEYDERQKEIRGKAYQYGFYAMMIYECIMIAVRLGGVSLPVEPYVLHFAGIVFGGMVLSGYSIWKDAYWGMNNDRKRYAIIFLVTAALNAIPVVASVKAGNLSGAPIMNVICLIMLGFLGAELLIKHLMDKGGEEE